jgi:hypothetical protein
VAGLEEALRRMEGRVAALERTGPRAPAAAGARRPAPPTGAAARAAEAGLDTGALTRGLSLGGRTLLVLAGAFVLRALTDAGTLPAWLGVALGFAYAGTWVAMADRAGRAGNAWSAGFHGLSAVAIGFPLLFEAASRFKLLPPVVAAATLAAFTAVALAMAVLRQLRVVAWLLALGGIPTAVALMVASGRVAPPALYLVLLGTATLWIGYVRGWVYLRWPVAVAADLAVAVMALRAVRAETPEGSGSALLLQVALMALYLGSIATRTLLLDRKVVYFEVVQTAAALLVGLGGAVFVASRTGTGGGVFGLVSVVFGVAAYAVAFAFVARRQQQTRENFYFYSSAAILFVLAGTRLVLPGTALPLAWSALAIASGVVAVRQGSRTLVVHGVAYALAASVASGLLADATGALFSARGVAWSPSAAALVALLAMGAGAWLATRAVARASILERLPQLLLLAALALSAGGAIAAWVAPAVGGPAGPGQNAAVVATVRTGVLAAGALLLAWMGRREAWREAGWLAYPVLAVTGLKILLEDLPRGRPATLFLTFATYGAALILVPRLRSRRQPASGAAAAGGKSEPRGEAEAREGGGGSKGEA